MIHRTPILDGEKFVRIRNEVIRDEKLSFLARGVLATVLSRPPDWSVSAERLAREAKTKDPGEAKKRANPGEGVKSIRRALHELEAAGYLKRQRVQMKDGGWAWEQHYYDVPQKGAGRTESPSGDIGAESIGEVRSLEPQIQTTDKELQDLKMCGTDFARSAPAVGGDDLSTQRDQRMTGQEAAEAAAEKRQGDRELYVHILGEYVYYYGKDYRNGRYESLKFYNDFRRKNVHWPGQYLEFLEERLPDGLEDWLLDHGLERVEV